MNKTKIEWCDYSSNPIYATVDGKRGWFCEKVSPGCAHCYSSTMNEGRFGNGLAFLPANRERVEWHLNEKELAEWQKQKYAGQRIFAFDMTDLFGEWVSDAWLDRCFAAMALSPATFLILTKRPERMREYFADPEGRVDDIGEMAYALTDKLPSGDPANDEDFCFIPDLPLPNVWLGVSVENQRWAWPRISTLIDTPAAVRFVSAEPLLGPLSLKGMLGRKYMRVDESEPVFGGTHMAFEGIDWVIVGGESGPRHRPFSWDWARSLRDQCADAGCAFFMKQAGGFRPGNALDELPSDLRIRDFPR